MPRKPRLEAQGLLYHIIARGIEGRNIFADQDDYKAFLSRLSDVLMDTFTKCYAFCLMPNHFHLLIKRDRTPVSTVMRRLLTGHAVNFNKKHKRTGHLFQNRYKSIICQEQIYLLELIRYIHLNPVRSGIVKTIDGLNEYRFSGHQALIGRRNFAWYETDHVLALFGNTKTRSRKAYLVFIKDGFSMGKNPVYSGGGLKRSLGYPEHYPEEKQAFDERILGDGDFVLDLIGREVQIEPEEPDPSKDFQELVAKVCRLIQVSPNLIGSGARARNVVDARAAIAFVAVTELGLTFAETARRINVNRSSVPKLLKRGEEISRKLNILSDAYQ